MKKRALLFYVLLAIALNYAQAQRPQVAILIFDGVEIIDFTAPYEVFGLAGFNVFTVAEKKQMLTTSMNLQVTPNYELREAPQADILVLPGGRVPHQLPSDDPKVQWLLTQAKQADWVLSVCNGAFVLGAAGLLKGRRATTTAGMVDHLPMSVEGVIPVSDQRFVVDGKFVTSGGLSAGLDGALFVVSQMLSKGRAREIANNMEYNWDASGKWVRSQLADLHLTKVMDFNPPLRRQQVLVYEGDETKWKCRYRVKRNETLAEFYKQFTEQAAGLHLSKWTLKTEDIQPNKIISSWEVATPGGKEWTCEAAFAEVVGGVEFGFYIQMGEK